MDQLISLAQTLGAAGGGVFAFLYWRADVERKQMTDLLLKLIPETTGAIKDCKASVDMLRVAVGGQQNAGG